MKWVGRTDLLDLLRERSGGQEHLLLARSDLCANKAGRVENSLRLLAQINSSHRRHIVDVIVTDARCVRADERKTVGNSSLKR